MNGRRRHERIFRSHSGYFHVGSLCPCSASRLVRLLMSLFILIYSRWSDAVQVTSGYLTVVEGATVVLPCKLTDTAETLTQISWQRRTRGKPQNDNFCEIERKSVNRDDDRFNFIGNLNEKNGSLQLSDVTLLDEGVYSCIFTLSLTGNYKAEVHLTVLVPPVTCVMGNAPVVGDEEVCLATCTAAGSRPPARVQWLTDTLTEQMRTVTESTLHPNGTTTTVSSLLGVPTREIKNCLVQCVITSPALPKEKTLPFTIQLSSGCINTTAHQSLFTVTLTLILLLTHCWRPCKLFSSS